jgi:hypothetical protein
MKQINQIRTKADCQVRASISGASFFNFGLNPKIMMIIPDEARLKTRGKSPPSRSRSPGSIVALNRTGNTVVCIDHGTRSKTEFYQKQHQFFINF